MKFPVQLHSAHTYCLRKCRSTELRLRHLRLDHFQRFAEKFLIHRLDQGLLWLQYTLTTVLLPQRFSELYQVLYPNLQLFHIKWLDNIVIRPCLQTLQFPLI